MVFVRTLVAGAACWTLVFAAAVPAAAQPAKAQGNPSPPADRPANQPPLVSGALTGIGDGMSEEQIRGFLRAKGYTDLKGFRREGDSFVIEHGKRYGSPVGELRVHAGTGQITNVQPLDRRQVPALLEQNGYTDVSAVEKDGDVFKARAKLDGKTQSLQVDARTATIRPACP